MSKQCKNISSKAIQEFERFAHQYNQYNVIQENVAKSLVSMISLARSIDTIIDIGCGSGAVYKNLKQYPIIYKKYIAFDSSTEMLTLHPLSDNVEKIEANFNKENAFINLSVKPTETLLLSSSALQWSKDLDFTFSNIAQLSNKAYFSIFTSNTFKTLHQTAGISSPIHTTEILRKTISKYYDAKFILKEYKLNFDTVRDMFRYIKKSGVSGGEMQLSYIEVKKVMECYPLDYLEFEVLFVEATSLAKASKV